MSKRLWGLILVCLLLLAGAWLFWPQGQNRAARKNAAPPVAAVPPQPAVTTTRSASTAPLLFGSRNAATNAVVRTNQFAYRLNNTPKSIARLKNDPHAVLLENAFILTGSPLSLSIPKHLKSSGDPGAYIVQAAGPINSAFRAMLASAGAQVVSYIPNNAYLVTLNAAGAAGLAGQPGVQSVLPYEPYYKISASLIGQAVEQKKLADNTALTLGLFAAGAAQTVEQIKQLGATVLATDQSPFGPIVRVQPPADWTVLAALPGVQIVEPAYRRALANDLARVTLGISTDTLTPTNYLNLYGSNVLVEVNDSGIDQTHPDFSLGNTAETPGAAAIGPGSGRVIGDSALSLVDTNGHGTHVAGIIAGNGWASYTVTNTPQGSVTNADFRGKASAARLYSVSALNNSGRLAISDSYLQSAPALTNALISNNSWNYVSDAAYDLAAASYDAAVRDALPLVTGSQPVLFVFSAGNDGSGDADGAGGNPDTILSPSTAKNVITVGALEQLRSITNVVTGADGVSNAVWYADTSSGNQVAGYSARGNVGIGTEGPYGRFKPDVVAPGSFVVSTRSAQWDLAAYYNPTNYIGNEYVQQLVEPNTLNYYSLSVPVNAVGVDIYVVPNNFSPTPFPTNMPIYVSQTGYATVTTYDFVTTKDQFSIPADTGAAFLLAIQNGGFNFAVGNNTNIPVNYDLITEITVTNGAGNYFTVLSNLNESIGPWYHYESGTSMAAPAVSGTLALIQDYFTNTLRATPSPALLKAMLINGATSQGSYEFSVTNNINLQGWGLPNLPASLPVGLTRQFDVPCSELFLDQSPTNALATGDSQTYVISITNFLAQLFPLRVTLAWTDPPGNPAAAIKLVNSLSLVVTNLDTGDVYFGNDLDGGSPSYSEAWDTNGAPFIDNINNVQNVFLQPLLAGNYSVTVSGRSVNVNAVTAQTNNVVQDYALVISDGGTTITNGMSVAASAPVSNLTGAQQITVVGVNANGMATNSAATGGVFFNQLAGANTPLLGTNMVSAGSNYAANAVITLGMTNQWHFYVVQNNTEFTNAAFVTFSPNTLATPRMGVFADTDANSTQPEADIDMYVSNDPGLTNLAPNVIAKCVNGTQVGVSGGANFNGASLSQGGTEYVVDTGSMQGQVYYVAVKSETAEAAQYGFLPVFSEQPFSTTKNGVETVNGLLLPRPIPDGSPVRPGIAFVFALAIQPIEVQNVTVSNTIAHQNFGDLIGKMTHNGKGVILNNHASVYDPLGIYRFSYYDGPVPVAGSQPPDGPGTLQIYQGQQGAGPWILTEVDDALTQTGAVTGLTLTITPHQDLRDGITVTLPPGGYFFGYIDAPVGTTNLTISATNISAITAGSTYDAANPGILYEKLGEQPAPPPTPLTNYDQSATLNNPGPTGPGATITVGPSDNLPIQPGRYFVTLWNNSPTAQQTFYIIATLGIGEAEPGNFNLTGPVPLLDDAVTYAYITNYPTANATNETIASIAVGLRVNHPRISDLAFHLISPDGTRYLLMENRGNTSTNGAGATIVTSTVSTTSATGTSDPQFNFINVGPAAGTLYISYNFYTVPDQMVVYLGFGQLGPIVKDTSLTNGSGQFSVVFPAGTGYVTVAMNPFGNPAPQGQDLWTYTAGGVNTNYLYLTFTDDTNLTTTPIKFAPPPLVPNIFADVVLADSFETYLAGTYAATFGGWTVLQNSVAIVTNPPAYNGVNALQLDNGAVSINLPTVAGQEYLINYQLGNKVAEGGGTATNANWQPQSQSFFATQASTPLVFNATGFSLPPVPGRQTVILSTNALVDALSVSAVPSDLYYQPEEDLSPLIGTSAYGLWTLEILDDRAGATNNAVLDSWRLQFVFANTNPASALLLPGQEICNTIPAKGILWYEVDVPLNADFATNTLVSAELPVNLLVNTNAPGTNGATTVLAGSTNGITLMGLTNTAPLLHPGTTYYLGVQNPNNVPVYACVRVDFHQLATAYAFTEPAQLVTGTNAQLNGMATPNGFAASAWFEWGTNRFYGNQTPPTPVGNGYRVVYVTNSIINLTPNVAYHFRLVVSNALGVAHGFDQMLDQANPVVWGANYVGQANVPAGLSNVVTIAGAYEHSLALKNDATAAGWGDALYGAATVPAGLSNIVALAGGESFSLALRSSGVVTAWGSDIYPGAGETNVPSGLSNVVLIASGQYSSLALKNDGTVVPWGASLFNPTNLPAGLSNIVSIAGGTLHSLAIKNDGTVVAWGDNGAGQTNVPAGLSNVVAVAAGSFHSLALQSNGVVVAWGYDSAGQTNVPAGLSNVVAIAAGGFHSLALKADGTLVGWGDNSAGQQNVPLGLTNFVAISAGYLNSLALTPQSLFGLTNLIVDLVPGSPQQGTILPGGIVYYLVNVPTNADYATNLFSTVNPPQTLNVWFTTNAPPTIATNAILLFPAATNGIAILTTNTTPPLNPGGTYYLALQNTNASAVSFNLEVDFHLVLNVVTAPVNFSSIVYTNINGTNGFLLTWFAPSNDLFQVQWTTNFVPPVWNTFTNPPVISYNTNFPASATNATFTFFDDGSQTGGFGSTRFYRLILLGSVLVPNTPPVLPSQATHTINPLVALVVTNTATDVQSPPQTLTYSLSSTITGSNLPAISPSGVITWTPAVSQAGSSNVFTTVVTDSGVPPLSDTNSFTVIVNPLPDISSVTVSNGYYVLTWLAPTNDIFEVQVATNIALPIIWQTIGANITYTGPVTPTNGWFSFLDNGSVVPFGTLRFYRLVLTGVTAPASPATTVSISSIVSMNGGFQLSWSAPTNYQFNVRWTTNFLPPPSWNTFPGTITSTNGTFTFTDTNTPLLMKFYDLILLP